MTRKTRVRIGIGLIALVGLIGRAQAASESYSAQVFYRDVTVAPWSPTSAVASIVQTNGGAWAATQAVYYALAATSTLGKTTAGPVTNITVTSVSNAVRIQWAVAGGASGMLLYRGSTSTNLTNYVATGVLTQYLDYGTNAWSVGTPANTVTSVPWLSLPSTGHIPTNDDVVRARDVAALSVTQFYDRATADGRFVLDNGTNQVNSQNIAEGTISSNDLGAGAVGNTNIGTAAVSVNKLAADVETRYANVAGDTNTGPLIFDHSYISMRGDEDDYLEIRDGWASIVGSALPEIAYTVTYSNNTAAKAQMDVSRYYDPIAHHTVTGGEIVLQSLGDTGSFASITIRATTNGAMVQSSPGAGMFFTAVNGTTVYVRINPNGNPVFQAGTNTFKIDAAGNVTATDVWINAGAVTTATLRVTGSVIVPPGTDSNQAVRMDQMVASNALLMARPASPFSFYYTDGNTNWLPISFGQAGATIIFTGSNGIPTIGYITATATNVLFSNLLDAVASTYADGDMWIFDATTNKFRNKAQTNITAGYALNADALDGYDSSAFQLYLGAVTNNGGYLRGWTNGTYSWESITASATDVVDTLVRMTHVSTNYSASASNLQAHLRGVDAALRTKIGNTNGSVTAAQIQNGVIAPVELLVTNSWGAGSNCLASTDGSTSFFWTVCGSGGSTTSLPASAITFATTPTNTTPAASNMESFIVALDKALGTLSGGGVTTLALTNAPLGSSSISGSVLLLGTNIGAVASGGQTSGWFRLLFTNITASTASVMINLAPYTAYVDLRCIVSGTLMSDVASTADVLDMRLNNVSGNAYSWQNVTGAGGSSPSSAEGLAVTSYRIGLCLGSTVATGTLAVSEFTLRNWTNITRNVMALASHTGRSRGWNAGDFYVADAIGQWQTTVAATSVHIYAESGNITNGSFELLGRLP